MSPPGRIAVRIHFALSLALAVWVATIVAPSIRPGPSFGIYHSNGGSVVILDFAAHLRFAKSVFAGGVAALGEGTAYSVAHHLKVVRDWSGEAVPGALVFGYSPTMLWLLAPLIALPAAAAFCYFTFAGVLAAWWLTRPLRSRHGLALAAFFSTIGAGCFRIGQTAILTGAGILLIHERTASPKPLSGRSLLIVSAVLWALTAKPPLAVTAGVVLIGLRIWKPVALALALTLATTVFAWPLLGAGWWRDYMSLLAHYDTAHLPPAFAWSIHPELMSNLRRLLNCDLGFGDDVAVAVSGKVWLVLLGAIALFGRRLRAPRGWLWAIALLGYLAFCPHVSPTESLQLVLLVPLCVSPTRADATRTELGILLVGTLGCFLAPIPGRSAEHLGALLFGVQIATMLWLVVAASSRSGIGEEGLLVLEEAGSAVPAHPLDARPEATARDVVEPGR